MPSTASVARFTTLQSWLDWQETLHPETIELGLERVGQVADRLGCRQPAPIVISVAGTNGKGSSVAMLESILLRAGYRVGSYTSPHLFQYNERIRLQGETVSDAVLCETFARIDSRREEISLTYFEFGTLAALDIFSRQRLDVAILEVGLGGRLDAVNIVDADVALITSVGIDHTAWLGNDRESIAAEKAGILRAGRPAVCADSNCPQAIVDRAKDLAAPLSRLGHDFKLSQSGRAWHWQGRQSSLRDLPLPGLPGAHQLANAAGVLQVLETLQGRLPVAPGAIQAGLKWLALPGRIQRRTGPVEQVLDVAHNAQAAQALADTLRQSRVAGRTYAVIGMMKDKQVAEFVTPLLEDVDEWLATGLSVERAMPREQLREAVATQAGQASVDACETVAQALAVVQSRVRAGDRVLVCGSFYTVAEWSSLDPVF